MNEEKIKSVAEREAEDTVRELPYQVSDDLLAALQEAIEAGRSKKTKHSLRHRGKISPRVRSQRDANSNQW